MRDLYNHLAVKQSLDAVIRTADANGDGVDLSGFEGAVVVAHFGISGDTLSSTVYAEIELEESDNDSTYTDVADADLLGKQAGLPAGTAIKVDDPAEDEATYLFGYRGTKKFIRPVLNLTGTHTVGIEVGVDVIKGFPRHLKT